MKTREEMRRKRREGEEKRRGGEKKGERELRRGGEEEIINVHVTNSKYHSFHEFPFNCPKQFL